MTDRRPSSRAECLTIAALIGNSSGESTESPDSLSPSTVLAEKGSPITSPNNTTDDGPSPESNVAEKDSSASSADSTSENKQSPESTLTEQTSSASPLNTTPENSQENPDDQDLLQSPNPIDTFAAGPDAEEDQSNANAIQPRQLSPAGPDALDTSPSLRVLRIDPTRPNPTGTQYNYDPSAAPFNASNWGLLEEEMKTWLATRKELQKLGHIKDIEPSNEATKKSIEPPSNKDDSILDSKKKKEPTIEEMKEFIGAEGIEAASILISMPDMEHQKELAFERKAKIRCRKCEEKRKPVLRYMESEDNWEKVDFDYRRRFGEYYFRFANCKVCHEYLNNKDDETEDDEPAYRRFPTDTHQSRSRGNKQVNKTRNAATTREEDIATTSTNQPVYAPEDHRGDLMQMPNARLAAKNKLKTQPAPSKPRSQTIATATSPQKRKRELDTSSPPDQPKRKYASETSSPPRTSGRKIHPRKRFHPTHSQQ